MADTPAPAARRGFNLSNPGMREYVIVGVVALGLGLWYFKRQQAKAATAQTQQSVGTPVVLAGAGGGGVPFGAFFAWLQNHQASPPATSTTTTGATGTGTADHDQGEGDRQRPHGSQPSATAPNVLNLGEAAAASVVSAAGWTAHFSGPQGSYVISQTPGPGATITRGNSAYWPNGQGKPTLDMGLK